MTDNSHRVSDRKPPSPRVMRMTNAILVLIIIAFVLTAINWLTVSGMNTLKWNDIPGSEHESLYCAEWGGYEGEHNLIYCPISEVFQQFQTTNDSYLDARTLRGSDGYARHIFDMTVTDIGNAFLATNGPNGGILFYAWHSNQYYNFTLFNITEDIYFTEIAWSLRSGGDLLYGGCASNPFGLAICDTSSHQVRILNTTHGLVHDFITYLKVRGNLLLIGTTRGFNLFDLESEEFVLSETKDDVNETVDVNSMEYYPLSRRLFVGTDDGLLVYEINNGRAELLRSRITEIDGLPHNRVNCLERDENMKRLYIGTYEGLSFINLDKEDSEIEVIIGEEEFDRIDIEAILIPDRVDYVYVAVSTRWSLPASIVRVPVVNAVVSNLTTIQLVLIVIGIVSSTITVTVLVILPEVRKTDNLPSFQEMIEMDESQILERKPFLRWNPRKKAIDKNLEYEVAEVIAAFMNTNQGIVLIGQDDSKNILGIENEYPHMPSKKKDRDAFEIRLTEIVNNKIGPDKFSLIKIEYEEVETHILCIITVEKSEEPVFVKLEGKVVFPIRQGSKTQLLDSESQHRYIQSNF